MTAEKGLLFTIALICGITAVLINPVQASDGEDSSAVNLREDGVILLNGKPFYPIGTYRDPRDDLADFRGVLEAGFNVTHSYYFEDPNTLHAGGKALDEDLIVTARRYLQEAHRHGLKVFMGLPRKMVKRGEFGAIREYVRALKNEPALLVWYLMDEPSVQKISPMLMKKVRSAVAETDPNHPTLVVFCRKIGGYLGSFDIAGFDPYPIKGKDQRVDLVRRFIEDRKKEAKGNLAFWHIVQGHDLRKPKKGDVHRPSPDQIRCMTFLGVISGARGTIFYWWPSAWCNILDFPEVWKEIGAINKDLKRLSPVLTAKGVSIEDIKIVAEPKDTFPYTARHHEGDLWVLAANPSGKKVEAILRLPKGSSYSRAVDALKTERKLVVQQNSCSLSLDALGICALKFSKSKKPNH